MELINELLIAIKKTKNTIQKKNYFLGFWQIVNEINEEIIYRKYSPSRFNCFAVRDPKPREIFSPHFRDRIIHHLLVDKINPLIDPKFIDDSFANRKDKGIHQAIKRLKSFLCKSKNSYYLQIDVKNFFASIDKNILYNIYVKTLLALSISDNKKDIFDFLAKKIIFYDPINPLPIFTGNKKLLQQIPPHKSLFHLPADKGLPIGSLSSQFFANLYLNELDQYAKHILKIKYYLRYVDDIIILADNTAILNAYKEKIDHFLKENLLLSLHPNKTILQPVKNGINFLGYVIRKDYILVRQRTVKSLKKRLYFFNHLLNPIRYPICNSPQMMRLAKLYKSENWQPPKPPSIFLISSMLATINSYYGIFSAADTAKLRKHLYQNHFGRLSFFFEPKDAYYKAMKIRKGAYLSQKS